MQFQSGVSVEVASVTGVLGAGEEVAVDFGLEDGTDEVGGVVVVVGGGTEVTVTTVVETFGEVTTVDGTVAGVDFAADALVIRRSKGDSALFAAAELVPDNDGRTIARDAISAAVVLPSVLAPGVDTKPAARNSSARTASVRARRGRITQGAFLSVGLGPQRNRSLGQSCGLGYGKSSVCPFSRFVPALLAASFNWWIVVRTCHRDRGAGTTPA